MNKTKYFAALAVVGTMFASCGEKDYYDPEEMEAITKAEYAANFEKHYGKVNPEQTWDFTSGPEYYLNATSTKATRAEGDPTVTKGEYYQVEKATLNWLTNTLKEGSDNRKLGEPFAMTAPNNSFTIVPIYQGQAALSWDLHMVVGAGADAKDVKIWGKSQGIQTGKANKKGNIEWTNLASGGNTLSAEQVRSIQYTIENVPVGETIYFYLEVTVGSDSYAKKGTKQSSLSGMMLALDCPRPSNIDEKNEVMIIGCEDANLSGTDWDLNDVVFLVYGNPDVPKPLDIKENTITQTQEKRYMIEDLGSTDDFDFNDIVVDVKGSRSVTFKTINGVIDYTQTEYGEWSQQASIVHLGGTLGFQLTIGNTKLEPMGGRMMGDDEELTDQTYDVTGWDPATNNVSIVVNQKESTNVFTIGFPKQGDVPMIIAFPTKQKWMPERESIPADWFTTE